MSDDEPDAGDEPRDVATEERPVAAAPKPAPKVDPATLELRGAPRRVARFRREIIVGVAAVGALSIAAIAWLALAPISSGPAAGDEIASKAQAKPPEGVAGAPGRYDEIPRLGPPLPGDLGGPILAHQRRMAGRYPSAPATDDRAAALATERERLLAQQTAALQSDVMMSIGAGWKGGPPSSDPEAPAARSSSGGHSSSARGVLPAAVNAAGAGVSVHRVEPAASPWIVTAGSVIPASLITGLNSDLPGLVVAQVSENIYDSVTGRTLLIPQGARLIGRYESDTAYGQQRALLAWQRIIWPNGSSLALEDAPASDPAGYAGVRDRVDSHGWQLVKGVALSTFLGVGTELSLGRDESELVRAMREAAQQSGSRAGDRLVARSLDIRPTIVIRPGTPVRVLVHKDIVLQPWRGGNH